MPEQEMPEAATTAVAIREQVPQGIVARAEIMGDEEVRRMWRVAAGLAESGLYKDVTQAGQAFAKMLVGRDYGLTIAQSMTLHVLEGKIEIPGVMIGSWINARQREGYKYVVRVLTNEACEIDFYGPDEFTGERELRGVSSFTVADAEQAELTGNRGTKTSNHVKYPRNMFWNRAMSNGAKWFVPEVLKGMAVYSEGEIEPSAADTLGVTDAPAVAVEFPPEVEALLQEAEECGFRLVRSHVAMQLGHQGPAIVDDWRQWARNEIDAHKMREGAPVPDATVVEEKPDPETKSAADIAEDALEVMVDETVAAVAHLQQDGQGKLDASLAAAKRQAENMRGDADALRDEARSIEDEAERVEKLAQADAIDVEADRLDGTQGSLL